MRVYKDLENIVRGFSNSKRMQTLDILSKTPDLSVLEVSFKIKSNYKTTSMHLLRLQQAGLITKKQVNNSVLHNISGRGIRILEFLRRLE